MNTCAKLNTIVIAPFLGALLATGVYAIEAVNVPEEKQSTLGLYFTAKEAHEYFGTHRDNALFVDVRDPTELQTVGMPIEAEANVPFKRVNLQKWDAKKSRFALDANPKFAKEVEAKLTIKGLTKKDVVIVICGSGVRAPKAVNALAKAGYTNAYSVIDGYKGWQEAKLPWSRKLDRVRMYTNSLAVQ